MPSVFISYSHKDKQWKGRLVEHLGVLQDQGLLDIWEDWQLPAGAHWHEGIQTALKSASIFVLLISARSLTSDYILHEEMTRAIVRRPEGVRIIPLMD